MTELGGILTCNECHPRYYSWCRGQYSWCRGQYLCIGVKLVAECYRLEVWPIGSVLMSTPLVPFDVGVWAALMVWIDVTHRPQRDVGV